MVMAVATIFFTLASVPTVLAHAISLQNAAAAPLPVVMWHGMGDNCCNHMSMGAIKTMVEEVLGANAYVVSLMIGKSAQEDTTAGFLTNVNDQVRMVCEQLSNDERLVNGFNAIGFSQGSQFMRAYVERCNTPKVHNLISMGGQHQGVYGLPHCTGHGLLCTEMRALLTKGAYLPFVQDKLVQAEYWHDPLHEDLYRNKSVFLADINNDRDMKNETYKRNLMDLNKFVMVKFEKDTMVTPIISEWFGWYKPGSDNETIPLQETTLYKEDWLGLQEMDKKGQLVFMSLEGEHLQFTDKWFKETIVQQYFS